MCRRSIGLGCGLLDGLFCWGLGRFYNLRRLVGDWFTRFGSLYRHWRGSSFLLFAAAQTHHRSDEYYGRTNDVDFHMLWIPSGLRRLLFCSSSDAGIDYARAVPNKIAVWGSFLTHLDLIAWEFSRSKDRSETL